MIETRDPRSRIIEAALALLTEGGQEAVSTRAVGAAAGVQAPTIYRLFGDKQGLLDAVAEHALWTYLEHKADKMAQSDPVGWLREGWDLHIGFVLANPSLFPLLYGDPRASERSPAAAASTEMLAAMVQRIAEAGRLKVSQERAVQLIRSAGSGTAFTLLSLPPERRDLALADTMRDALIGMIITDEAVPTVPSPVTAAVALRAVLAQSPALTAAERTLMEEWLARIADAKP